MISKIKQEIGIELSGMANYYPTLSTYFILKITNRIPNHLSLVADKKNRQLIIISFGDYFQERPRESKWKKYTSPN